MCASHEHLSKMALKLVEMLAMQAMNFLAALLLLLMPEEDAFWCVFIQISLVSSFSIICNIF